VREFDLLNAIGAVGNGSAGHYAHGFAGFHSLVPTFSGGRLANDAQTHRRGGRVTGAHCITIHLRSIERREIGIGDDLVGQDAAESVWQVDFLTAERVSLLPHDLDRFGD